MPLRPAPDFAEIARRAESNLTPARLDDLGRSLCLPSSALTNLSPGWLDREDLLGLGSGGGKGWTPDDGAFVIPELDPARKVIGLSFRTPEGSKGAPRGAARGLVFAPLPDGEDELILVVEGASDVASCHALGLPAVGRPSNSGGAAELAVLLKDRRFIVVGERDQKPDGKWPGKEGAQALAERLAEALGTDVQWALPPEGSKDVRDWVRRNAGDILESDDPAALAQRGQDFKAWLISEIRTAPAPKPRGESGCADREPYPTHLLPQSLRDLAEQGAVAMGTEESMIAVPCLVACASAIGLCRSAEVKAGWTEPSILWCAVVASSGAGKDPSLDLATKPLRAIDARCRQEGDRANRAHRRAEEAFKRDLKTWRDGSSEAPPPDEPEPPHRERIVVQDATYEAMVRILEKSEGRALVSIRPEMSALLREWVEHQRGRAGSSNAPKWLELYGARCPGVDRVGDGEIIPEEGALNLIGAIQPGILVKEFEGAGHIDSGCAARLLWTWPDVKMSLWTDETVAPAVEKRYEAVVEDLFALRDTERAPIPFSPAARKVFTKHFNAWVPRAKSASEAEVAAIEKLRGATARIALVIELIRAAERGCAAQVTEISASAVEDAAELARWHHSEARRVLELLGAKPTGPHSASPDSDLVDWVTARGEVRARDVAKGVRRFRGSGGTARATAALDQLCGETGPLRKVTQSRGGALYMRRVPDAVDGSAADDTGRASSADADGGDPSRGGDTDQLGPAFKEWDDPG